MKKIALLICFIAVTGCNSTSSETSITPPDAVQNPNRYHYGTGIVTLSGVIGKFHSGSSSTVGDGSFSCTLSNDAGQASMRRDSVVIGHTFQSSTDQSHTGGSYQNQQIVLKLDTVNHIIASGMMYQENNQWQGPFGGFASHLDTGRVVIANVPYTITDSSLTARIDGSALAQSIVHFSQGSNYPPISGPAGACDSIIGFEGNAVFMLSLKH